MIMRNDFFSHFFFLESHTVISFDFFIFILPSSCFYLYFSQNSDGKQRQFEYKILTEMLIAIYKRRIWEKEHHLH